MSISNPHPIIVEPTHGELILTETPGETLSNQRCALLDRLFDIDHTGESDIGAPITVTGEELTNFAKAWLRYVQEHTDAHVCPLCNRP